MAGAAEALGVKALAIRADSTDPRQVTEAVDRAAGEWGGLDILVNNAGVALMAPIDQFRLEDFDRTVAVNLRAVFVATQAAVRHVPAGGRIINIGSCNAERMPFGAARSTR
jgi:3-oxoacyl-[acyl-carrier protein] reductase